jgi:hypothetical protein
VAAVKPVLWTACAATLLGFTSPACAVTGKELLRRCEAVERGAVGKGEAVELPAGRPPAECWFYMAAVQDLTATVEQEGGPSLLGSCVPAKTTRLDLVRAFAKYARAHRSDLDTRASAIIVLALADAFPCGERARK